jgi:hypothetical protein
MTENPLPTADSPDCLKFLDDLIERSALELKKSLEGKVKLGDFLKMIEMRRKLDPEDLSEKAFWEMIDRIKAKIQNDNPTAPAQIDPAQQTAVEMPEQ